MKLATSNIHQLTSALAFCIQIPGILVVFMGDDTWMGMLPGRFDRAFPFPSFNVRDLHTVDLGVMDHLMPLLTAVSADAMETTWDVIVAHFLGVDHCGHIHGPNHPEMTNKLMEMNNVIRSVIDLLDNDTVLFVFGDHGMTKTGDHGGDSAHELESALFVYSRHQPLGMLHSPNKKRVVNQIDFAATFSLLMGIPIPFGNLGTIIKEFFEDDHEDFWSLSESALYLNVKQVDRFLKAYEVVSDEFAGKTDEMREIKSLLSQINVLWNERHPRGYHKNYSDLKTKCIFYLSNVQKLCRDMWAKFELAMIFLGLFITGAAIFVSCQLRLFSGATHCTGIVTAISLCGLGFLELSFSMHSTLLPTIQIVVGWDVPISSIISTFHVFVIVFKHIISRKTTFREQLMAKSDLLAIGVCFLYFGINFSNSYVVCEDLLTSFLFMTMLFGTASQVFAGNVLNKVKRTSMKVLPTSSTRSKFICIGAALLASVCVRAQAVFWRCREEQWWCIESDFLIPLLSSIESEQQRTQRLLLAFLAVILIVISANYLLRRAGNLNGHRLTVLSAIYLPILMCLCICSFWALVALRMPNSAGLSNYVTLLPNFVLFTGTLGILILFLKPLSIYEVYDSGLDGDFQLDLGFAKSRSSELIIPQVFRHLKSNWQKQLLSPSKTTNSKNSLAQKPLVVYGLATTFSSTLVIAVTYVVLLLVILIGDAYVPSVILSLLSMAAVAHFCATFHHSANSDNDHLEISWCWVVIFAFLSSICFYASGHQQTFPTLHWESAEVGSGDVDPTLVPGGHLIPAVKIIANTFASTIVFSICLPFLILWRASSRVLFATTCHQNYASKNQGDFELMDNPAFFHALQNLFLKYMTVQGVKLFGSMLAAALLRRHLMVWKIFAPRFVYEAGNFVVCLPSILVVYLLVLRTNRALRQWMNEKEIKQVQHTSMLSEEPTYGKSRQEMTSEVVEPCSTCSAGISETPFLTKGPFWQHFLTTFSLCIPLEMHLEFDTSCWYHVTIAAYLPRNITTGVYPVTQKTSCTSSGIYN